MKHPRATASETILLALISVSCAGGPSIGAMDAAERAFNERQREQSIHARTVNELYPDPKVVALAEAAASGDIDRIDQLVSEGVDVNYRGFKDVTPLLYALQDIDGFARLLEHGADPNLLDANRQSPISRAAKMDDPQFLEAALRYGGDANMAVGTWHIADRNAWLQEPVLHSVLDLEAMDKIRMLLAAGADLDARDSWGDTALHQAADANQFDVMYFLLEQGADYTIRDRTGVNLATRLGAKTDRQLLNEKSLYRVIGWLEERGMDVPSPEAARALAEEAAKAYRKAHGDDALIPLPVEGAASSGNGGD